MYLSHRATKALSWRKINRYQVSVTKKRHLASRRRLLQIVRQAGVFQGVQKRWTHDIGTVEWVVRNHNKEHFRLSVCDAVISIKGRTP